MWPAGLQFTDAPRHTPSIRPLFGKGSKGQQYAQDSGTAGYHEIELVENDRCCKSCRSQQKKQAQRQKAMARFCRVFLQQAQQFLRLFPLYERILDGDDRFSQFLPFFRRPLRPVRLAGLKRGTDIFRPGSLPFFFFPGIRFQIVGQRQGPVPVSLFGDLPSGPSGKGLAVLIFVVLPVHFLVFMIRQFFLSLLPLGHVMIQFINLGTTDDPSVPFLFESRPFAAGRFQFLYFFIDFPDFTFQFFPALSPVGREL